MCACCVFAVLQAIMILPPREVIIRLRGAPTTVGAAVIVTVTEIVTDAGAVNERAAADEDDQSTGHRRLVIVIKAEREEGLLCWPKLC